MCRRVASRSSSIFDSIRVWCKMNPLIIVQHIHCTPYVYYGIAVSKIDAGLREFVESSLCLFEVVWNVSIGYV